MVEIQRKKQAAFDVYVSNQTKAQAFKMAMLAYKAFRDVDEDAGDKYKRKMEDIIDFETGTNVSDENE